MSQFLVVKDLNFDNIMICFDNSSNELEYTTYVVDTKDKTNIAYSEAMALMEAIEGDYFERLPEDTLPDNLNNIYLRNCDDEIETMVFDFREKHNYTVEHFKYKEHDGGVQEIPVNQSIYSSRFDDMRDAMMQVLGGYINTEHIFEIEE